MGACKSVLEGAGVCGRGRVNGRTLNRPLLKYISGAVAPRQKAPKGPSLASFVNVMINDLNELRIFWGCKGISPE